MFKLKLSSFENFTFQTADYRELNSLPLNGLSGPFSIGISNSSNLGIFKRRPGLRCAHHRFFNARVPGTTTQVMSRVLTRDFSALERTFLLQQRTQ
jgi:hypothetical protein